MPHLCHTNERFQYHYYDVTTNIFYSYDTAKKVRNLGMGSTGRIQTDG